MPRRRSPAGSSRASAAARRDRAGAQLGQRAFRRCALPHVVNDEIGLHARQAARAVARGELREHDAENPGRRLVRRRVLLRPVWRLRLVERRRRVGGGSPELQPDASAAQIASATVRSGARWMAGRCSQGLRRVASTRSDHLAVRVRRALRSTSPIVGDRGFVAANPEFEGSTIAWRRMWAPWLCRGVDRSAAGAGTPWPTCCGNLTPRNRRHRCAIRRRRRPARMLHCNIPDSRRHG